MELDPADRRRQEIHQAAPEGSAEWTAALQAQGQALRDRGDGYFRRGEARRAVASFEEALAIARQVRQGTPKDAPEWMAARQDEAAVLGSLALAYAALGEARRAIDLYKQALAIGHEIHDACPQDSPLWWAARQGAGVALGHLGLIYADLGDARRAIGAYEQSLAIGREMLDATTPGSPEWRAARGAEGHTLTSLGHAQAVLGDLQRAVVAYEQALAIHRQLGDRGEEGAVLVALGNAYAATGQARRAIGAYEEALALVREVYDTATQGSPKWVVGRRTEANTLDGLGAACKSRGEIGRAIECIEQSLAIYRELGDRPAAGGCLSYLGNAYAELGKPLQAIDAYERALALHRDLGDWRRAAADLANLGLACVEVGRARQAAEAYAQCLAIQQQHGDRRSEANALCNLAMACTAVGELQQAVGYCEQALAIHREMGDWRGEGNALAGLGSAYAALGELQQAIGAYQQALAIARQMGDREAEAADLGNLGRAYGMLGEARRAIGYFERSLALHREIRDAARRDSSEWRAARRGEGNDLGNLGNAWAALGEAPRAVEYYEQHLAAAREAGDRRGEAGVSFNLAQLLVQQKRLREALPHAERAAQILAEGDGWQPDDRAQQLVAQIRALLSSPGGRR